MTLHRNRRPLLLALALATLGLASARAQAPEFPSRPITIIVPYPAGGIADAITRIIAEKVSKTLGQPVNVDPRPGGNANIGTQAALRAAPDGHTWLFAATAITANASLYKGLWDPLKDFTGVSITVYAPSLVTVPTSLGVRDIKDVCRAGQAQPRQAELRQPGQWHVDAPQQ